MTDFIKPPLYKQVLEIIFPPSTDELILRRTPKYFFYSPTTTLSNDVWSLFPYQQPAVRAAIHLAKFHHHNQAINVLAQGLIHFLSEHTGTHTIIPIPLSTRRERERGYNQVLEILRAARRHDPSLAIDTASLIRTRHTTPQTSLTKTERLQNMTDAFSVRRPERIHQQSIILVDDVTTTGATLEAARAALAPHTPRSITCVALAH